MEFGSAGLIHEEQILSAQALYAIWTSADNMHKGEEQWRTDDAGWGAEGAPTKSLD